jgi:lipopolysaccharide export system permease protein
MMVHILPRYFRKRFFSLFFYCLLSTIIIFLVVDLVENFDRFIDRQVPWQMTVQYYLLYIPYLLVLIMPASTLLATVFSIGSMARHNELVALKALGYSLYRIMGTLLFIGFVISVFTFCLSEGLVVYTNREKESIEKEYLGMHRRRQESKFENLVIQEPPDKIIAIGRYDSNQMIAYRVKIETFLDHRLVSKLDAPRMRWDGDAWIVDEGVERNFYGDREEAATLIAPRRYKFQFNPRELLLAQLLPDAMTMKELNWFVKRIRQTGGEVRQWMTGLHMRISYPMTNLIIVLFSVPIAFNRRKKNVALGFGLSLLVCFLYFGLIKTGQTMGEKGSLFPMGAAWFGNGIMGLCGLVNLMKTRK